MKNKKIYLMVLLLIVLLVLIGVYFLKSTQEPRQVTSKIFDQQKELALLSNTRIITAMNSFKTKIDSRKENNSSGLFCTGGFISNTQEDLKVVVDEIIKNRIIDVSPIQYAKTQDEAGITCLVSAEEWVLFSALNDDSYSEKKYWCVDSTGFMGSSGFDSKTNQCLKTDLN